MIIAGSIILVLYSITLGILFFAYYSIQNFKDDVSIPCTKFSIIIPFRNEAKVLPSLLGSIGKLNYPNNLFEIIFVDDGSEDNSAELIKKHFKNSSNDTLHFRIIKNERRSASPKKDAITMAVKKSENDWILTTDADCILPKNWLLAFDNYIQLYQAKMIAGPVQYLKGKGLANQYQQLDNYSLQTTTVGGFGLNRPLLCNGANLGYLKKEFIAVEGYTGNDHIASGDDIFLLEKLKKRDAKGIHFIKNRNSIVLTRPEVSWSEIIRQRIRWASKTSGQNNSLTKLIGLLVFLCNLFILWFGVYSVFNRAFFIYFVSFLIIKSLIDYVFLLPTKTFFETKINIFYFLLNILIYPIITVIVVFGSLMGTYHWKGRTFKK